MPRSTIDRRSSGSMTARSASVTSCARKGHRDCRKRSSRRPIKRPQGPVIAGGEVAVLPARYAGQLLRARQPLEAARARCRSDELGPAPEPSTGVLGLDAVLLHGLRDLGRFCFTVARPRGGGPSALALDPVAGGADALGGLAASLAATTLEPVELAADLGAKALQLPLATAGAGPRLDGVADAVAGGQRGADRNVERALGALADDVDGALARLGAALADLGGVASWSVGRAACGFVVVLGVAWWWPCG